MSLFTNPKKVRTAIYCFCALLVIALGLSVPKTCKAAEFDLGIGKTYLRGPTTTATATVVWPNAIGRKERGIDLYAGAVLIGEYSYEGYNFSNQLIARAGITPHIGPVGVSLGLAKIQNSDALNSGNLNFNIGLSVELGKSWKLNVGHFSNAGTHAPNTGRDLIYIERRFR